MATGGELIERVQKIYQDGSYDDDEVLVFLNEGLQAVAFSEDVFLPTLDTSAELETVLNAEVADLPANCSEGFYSAFIGTQELTVHNSWTEMKRTVAMESQAGTVTNVSAKADELYYFPVPEEVETITIFYYRAPTELRESTEPDCFTVKTRAVGESALVAYALIRIFEAIEDGMEGQKVNTLYWEKQYERSMTRLKSMIRSGVSAPQKQRNARW